ncbi:MAG: tRNA glutamyl-Q(34) synthetase GluQRS [Elusimicrobia bacterium]|nr:tRNA glutamyl-Q(34) synthetase GluQRS [Elusimicrobiota bacterium]
MARTTRLAPSPTGALHLGNARTFLINWALARRNGWRIVLRVEDLDGPRIKPEAVDGIMETLRWLGLDWDAGPPIHSRDLAPSLDAMESLAGAGKAFPCALTRGQIASAASAPQDGAHELRYPATLRPPDWEERFHDIESNWRLIVPDLPIRFEDSFAGPQSINPAEVIGDFIVWTKRGAPAYQLAVVVDDHRQGVTDVVRGADLLDSAARQLLVYRALGLKGEPSYWHVPLVVGPDGKRLAKRHGDSRIDEYRRLGVAPSAVIGLLAGWSGLERRPMSAHEFAEAFEPSALPRTPVVFSPGDDAWLNSR